MPSNLELSLRNTNLKKDAEAADLRARAHGAARADVEEKARGLLFDMALSHNKLRLTIAEFKKRWPEQAAEMERIAGEVSKDVDGNNEYKERVLRAVATNI